MNDIIEEIQFDREFDRELARKRHNELVRALQAIPDALKGIKDESVSEEIRRQNEQINRLAEAIRNIPKPEKPEAYNNDNVVSSIEKMGNELIKQFASFQKELSKPKPKQEWTFQVHRNDYTLLIESITAKQL